MQRVVGDRRSRSGKPRPGRDVHTFPRLQSRARPRRRARGAPSPETRRPLGLGSLRRRKRGSADACRLAGSPRHRATRRGHRRQHIPEHGPRAAAPARAPRRGSDDRLRAGPPPPLPLLLRRRLSTLRRGMHLSFPPPAPERRRARMGGGSAHRHAMAEAKRGRGAGTPGEFAQVRPRESRYLEACAASVSSSPSAS